MNRDMRAGIRTAAKIPSSRGDDGSIQCDFHFAAGFVGFAGHFEGYPILPAVAQMLAAQMLVEELHPYPLRLQGVSHAKFLQQLGPGQTFTISCSPKKGAPHSYEVRIRLGDELASSFQLRFTPGETSHG